MSGNRFLFVGTYTKPEPHVNGHAEGISTYRFNPDTGRLSYSSTTAGIVNPSFLSLHPQKPVLYAVSEVEDFHGEAAGGIASYRINEKDGSLHLLNMKSTEGTGPCHVCVDGTGRLAAAANYLGGSVTVFPINRDGSLSDASCTVQHYGRSINPERQEGPHPHSVNIDSTNRFLIVPDLGLDRVFVYGIDWERLILTRPPREIQVPAGSGPRHFCIHPDRKKAYVVNEMGSAVTVLAYDAGTCGLVPVQTVSTLPEHFTGFNTAADIHIHPSGKYLYASNRGHDSIAVYRITGTGLVSAGHFPGQGKTPRNFTLSPDGRFLLTANQDTDTITVFSADGTAGTLELSFQIEEASPVCLQFL